jgi:hypothetical protein
LASLRPARFIPATINAKPVTIWVNIPIAWNLAGHTKYRSHKIDDDQIQIPIIQKSYRLKAGPSDYPAELLTLRKEGDCAIHALIDKDGTPTTYRSMGHPPT